MVNDSQPCRRGYAHAAIEYGWSRAVLVHQIETKLFQRQGKSETNFTRTLPSEQSDMAQQILKDPYHFDFLTLGPSSRERAWGTRSSEPSQRPFVAAWKRLCILGQGLRMKYRAKFAVGST